MNALNCPTVCLTVFALTTLLIAMPLRGGPAESLKPDIVVAADGGGDFKTIQEALDSITHDNRQRIIIFIKDGVYHEKVRIDPDFVTLRGQSRRGTRLEFPQGTEEFNQKPDKIGRAVVNINGSDCVIQNLTVKNTHGVIGPHAFAVYGTADKTVITDCDVLSQGADTLALAWSKDQRSRSYQARLDICGSVDFVCPRGWSYMADCTLHQVNPKADATIWHDGYKDKDMKFVVRNCRFDGAAGVNSWILARHHRDAQFFLLDCAFSGTMSNRPLQRVIYPISGARPTEADIKRNHDLDAQNIWGERAYFYNCHREGGDYSWHTNNLSSAPGSPKPEQITAAWTFAGTWDPERSTGPVIQKVEQRDGQIEMTFGESVTVKGNPRLVLQSGGYAEYASGSGGTNLFFSPPAGSRGEVVRLDLRGGAIIATEGSVAVRAVEAWSQPATNAIPEFAGEFIGQANRPEEPMSLWYRRPATKWVEALPIGNGRLGAMVFGGIDRERLQLNEDTLWAGGPYDPNNVHARAALPEVRRLIFEGKYAEAEKLVGKEMMATPLRQMPYEPVGDLWLTFPSVSSVEDYRRDLNLDTAIARVAYTAGDVTFQREMFSSPIDRVIVIRLTASKPGQISFVAGMETPQKASVTVEDGNTLVMRGVNGSSQGISGALKFEGRVRIIAYGGKTAAGSNTVSVSGADSATLLIAAATSYRSYKDVSGDPDAVTKQQMRAASQKSYESLRAAHIAEHQRLFRRVQLDLGATDAGNLPTDERIAGFAKGGDPQLAALYFQFGRYLLISCSRPGGQPANLQGLWNESMNPPWGSKYTININTEMNYWPAEPGNLGECSEPLFAMIRDLSRTGARTAKVEYGACGWVAHHNTDLWRATAPIDGPQYGMWPTGGAWLCQQMWEHYLFTGDKRFLSRVYPIMRGSAQFFLDTLVEEPTHHWLVTCPSLSPEHKHPFGASVCDGPTMDNQILRDLFSNCVSASEILDVDRDFRARLMRTRNRLAPNQIGKAGQLQEWLEDWDMEAPDIHHRHVSHLYGLFPSAQITLRGTPELAAAARRSLEIRGDRATGWATAWRANLWARLHEGDHAYEILAFLLSPERTYPDMFDAHPPFQIDGNFGGANAIAEMLLQSQAGEIEFLPALPKAWPTGSVKGLRARGGFEVDMSWKDGKLESATMHSISGRKCQVRYGEKVVGLTLKPGLSCMLDGDLNSK
ncbi:MAG TPA: pectinesterase family protein [Verrucomicrobiae bacterium]|nr:pectinesterase family protein [Verrucomicrobiae bacterium]